MLYRCSSLKRRQHADGFVWCNIYPVKFLTPQTNKTLVGTQYVYIKLKPKTKFITPVTYKHFPYICVISMDQHEGYTHTRVNVKQVG